MELTKNFEPQGVEEKWSEHWKRKGYFNSTPDERKPFTVVIPPPNVTGVLHMGHTLNETVQDILVRKARMSGFNACWVPGSDHASIATEAKVVQMLENEKGIKKSKLSRDEFLKYAYEWKDKYGDIIYHQIRKLGCSVDWNRVTFTMDPHYYEAVIKVFIDLYKKGMIYRGARMINWDPSAKTALSDEEVEYKELQGKLFYVKYFISSEFSVQSRESGVGSRESDPGYIVIATQRPETIMGDTAVCVNPNDERYAHLRGKYVIVPLVNRKVPVIFDDYVDPAFGTGALKVTPAHDINDYNLGLKHNLQIIDTLNEDGTLSENAEVFVGLDRFEARTKTIEKLRDDGLMVKEEEYTTRLGFSQRTNAVVEPRISTQWFVRMKGLAEKALIAVTSGEVKIHPEERFLATYKYWLENVKDWCISRQLWWGQRIPAWYDEEGNVYVAATEKEAIEMRDLQRNTPSLQDETRTNATETTKDTAEMRGLQRGSPPPQGEAGRGPLTQDEDVLDTWFSSWLWPMEVFNGITDPGNKDINYYYPGSVLVTGQDIIFFWVARMIMAGMEYKNEKPFEHVYFTGMVRDRQGRKMSKSLGNSPDLLDLIDRYGADAVRFGIMISSPAGNDLLFDESSLEQGRAFNNKIWNALKLVRSWEGRATGLAAGTGQAAGSGQTGSGQTGSAAAWFDSRLNEAKLQLEKQYADFKLSEALKTIYSLIWDDFCSWYLEWVKPGFEQPIDAGVYKKSVHFFEQLMQLLHPFMPFVTEEIYHHLSEKNGDLAVSQLKEAAQPPGELLQQGELLKEVITAVRDARVKNNLKPKETINLHIQASDESRYKAIETILVRQTNAEAVIFSSNAPANCITVVIGKDRFYIEPRTEVDTAAQKEQLLKDLDYLKGFLLSVDKKLGNEKFVANAKPEVVAIELKKKADALDKIRVIEESLKSL